MRATSLVQAPALGAGTLQDLLAAISAVSRVSWGQRAPVQMNLGQERSRGPHKHPPAAYETRRNKILCDILWMLLSSLQAFLSFTFSFGFSFTFCFTFCFGFCFGFCLRCLVHKAKSLASASSFAKLSSSCGSLAMASTSSASAAFTMSKQASAQRSASLLSLHLFALQGAHGLPRSASSIARPCFEATKLSFSFNSVDMFTIV